MRKLSSFSPLLISLTKSSCHKIRVQLFNSVLTSSRVSDSLYGRISPAGDPAVSIVPVLDQWVRDGNSVDKRMLQGIINELKNYKRFKHALEVSQWMTDKRYFNLSSSDVGMRMHLIFKLHGLEQVEDYFSNIPQSLKLYNAHISLLNCYCFARSVDKAEALMQKVKAIGYVTMPVWYNNMMNLYYNLGNLEKLDFLMDEMEERGIHPDKFTHIVRLRAYSDVSDSVGIEKVVRALHSDPQIIWDWSLYGVIAAAYLKVGSTDKALPMLQKMEHLMENGKKKDSGIRILFHLYSEAGKKDELYRIWKKYKKDKVNNNVYKSMISSLMKLKDIDGAESIFSEWESSALSYDFQIVNYLIDAYCRNGSLKKAEDLLNRGISRGGRPNADTWCNLAGGYIMDNKLAEAIDSLKKAVSLPNLKHINLETLNACLEYLEQGFSVDEFIRSSSPKCVPSMSVLDKLFCFIKTGQLPSDSGAPSGEDVTTDDEMMN